MPRMWTGHQRGAVDRREMAGALVSRAGVEHPRTAGRMGIVRTGGFDDPGLHGQPSKQHGADVVDSFLVCRGRAWMDRLAGIGRSTIRKCRSRLAVPVIARRIRDLCAWNYRHGLDDHQRADQPSNSDAGRHFQWPRSGRVRGSDRGGPPAGSIRRLSLHSTLSAIACRRRYDADMNIEQARALMNEWTPSPALRVHMECVAACMGAYAERLEPAQKDRWILCGLLHDFDYEKH